MVLDFGIFVCNTCSGIHRELTHKVKGMGMSNFNEKDVEKIQKWGNSAAKKHWMAGHNKTLYPIPERRDLTKMKEFMRMKYVQKRFLEDEDASDNSDEDSEEEDKRKKHKKKKKAKKPKKSKKKKRKHESSDDSDKDDDSDSEEESKTTKPTKPIKQGKTGYKPGTKLSAKLGKPKTTMKAAKTSPPVQEPKQDLDDILGLGGFDSGPAPSSASQNDNGGNGWAEFESGTPKENKPAAGNQNELWGAFDTPKQNEKKTSDLIGSLGNLYGEAAQKQQQQMNPFGGFTQPGMAPMAGGMPQAPTPGVTATPTAPTQTPPGMGGFTMPNQTGKIFYQNLNTVLTFC